MNRKTTSFLHPNTLVLLLRKYTISVKWLSTIGPPSVKKRLPDRSNKEKSREQGWGERLYSRHQLGSSCFGSVFLFLNPTGVEFLLLASKISAEGKGCWYTGTKDHKCGVIVAVPVHLIPTFRKSRGHCLQLHFYCYRCVCVVMQIW